MSSGNTIRHLSDTATFKEFLNNDKTKNQLYVIDFHATWCKPCKRVSPLYDKLCNSCSDVVYFKCDVDDADELAEVFEVRSVPTFIFAYNRTILEKMEGANIKHIEAKVNELKNATDRKYTLLTDEVEGQDDGSEKDDGSENDGGSAQDEAENNDDDSDQDDGWEEGE